jgi:hypothetical protein
MRVPVVDGVSWVGYRARSFAESALQINCGQHTRQRYLTRRPFMAVRAIRCHAAQGW